MASSRYQFRELVGQGKTSLIYRAVDTVLDREVAIKWLRDDCASRAEYRGVLVREAQQLASLEHPHILPIYDFGFADERPFIVSRFVPQRQPFHGREGAVMSAGDVCALARQVADAIDYCRSCGIAHRDVKPENILVDSAVRVYMADFGLSCKFDSDAYRQGAGDVRFMAPEQIPATPFLGIGEQCDQFSLGVSIHLLLTGDLPLPAAPPGKYSSVGPSMRECTAFRLMCREHLVLPSQLADIPKAVDDVVSRMLAVDPGERFPDSCEATTALTNAVEKNGTLSSSGIVFVSYSRADAPFVQELVGCLHSSGLGVWWDHLMPKGPKWDEEIEEALDKADAMLVVLTPNSANSTNVRDEWNYWLELQRPICTLVIGDCKLPFRLRRINHIFGHDRSVGELTHEIADSLHVLLAREKRARPTPQPLPEAIYMSGKVQKAEDLEPNPYIDNLKLKQINLQPLFEGLGDLLSYIPSAYQPELSSSSLRRYITQA